MRLGSPFAIDPQKPKNGTQNHKCDKFYLKPVLLIANLYIYFRKGANVKWSLGL